MKLTCKQCWCQFLSDRSNKIYCSRVCYGASRIWKPILHIDYINRVTKSKKRKNSKCVLCWDTFEHHSYRNAKYCSKECRSKRKPKILQNCLCCWKEYWGYLSCGKLYCWNKCRWIHLRELKKWENSPFWKWWVTKQNKLDRSRTIYIEWRKMVFDRDNYTCRDCGIKSWKWVQIYLNAHHLKWFADYPESRHDVDNGITLCKDCHILRHSHNF